MYHHCRLLEHVIYDKVSQVPDHEDGHMEGAFRWLENEVGFYPLFLSVGTAIDDIHMAGYFRNFQRWNKREFPNKVLFSYDQLDGEYMDYDLWHIALNSEHCNYKLTPYETRLILKRSWNKSDWLRKARKQPHSVQMVVPALSLPSADRLWVRNKQTKLVMEDMGFENVEVKRVKVPDWI